MIYRVKCIIYEKEFDIVLPQLLTLVKCPICNDYIRYNYYFIGLSNSVAPQIKGWHKIIRMNRNE